MVTAEGLQKKVTELEEEKAKVEALVASDTMRVATLRAEVILIREFIVGWVAGSEVASAFCSGSVLSRPMCHAQVWGWNMATLRGRHTAKGIGYPCALRH